MNNIDILARIITQLQNDVERLKMGVSRKIAIPSDGYLIIKAVSSDPTSPANGEIWFNIVSNQIKVNNGGTIKAVTLT